MRVVHGDAHGLVRAAVRRALVATEFELVGEAATGAALVPLVRRSQPDLVLLELRLPGRDGLSCLRLLRERYPQLPLILLADEPPSEIELALESGASGFISKQVGTTELMGALRSILSGDQQIFADVHRDDPSMRAREFGLSRRESAILAAIARGDCNKTIARALCLTEQTVKGHLTSLYRKLGVANRTQAAQAGYRLGLVDSPVLSAR